MKRTVLLTITMLLMISTLTSCIVIPRYKRFEIDADQVASVEIYDLCENETFGGEFLKTEAAVYEIPKERVSDFFNDLSKIRFFDTIIIVLAPTDPSFYYDTWVVRINYRDGSYELLSSDGYGEVYYQNGEVKDSHHYSCDNEEWWAFIEKYVPESIFDHSHKAV